MRDDPIRIATGGGVGVGVTSLSQREVDQLGPNSAAFALPLSARRRNIPQRPDRSFRCAAAFQPTEIGNTSRPPRRPASIRSADTSPYRVVRCLAGRPAAAAIASSSATDLAEPYWDPAIREMVSSINVPPRSFTP